MFCNVSDISIVLDAFSPVQVGMDNRCGNLFSKGWLYKFLTLVCSVNSWVVVFCLVFSV